MHAVLAHLVEKPPFNLAIYSDIAKLELSFLA